MLICFALSQIMLQATHGIVSGNKPFFYAAYGKDVKEFKRLLTYPHGFIFHRHHYEAGAGKEVRAEYEHLCKSMSTLQAEELMEHLATPIGGEKVRSEYYKAVVNSNRTDQLVRRLISFHVLGTKTDTVITKSNVLPLFQHLNPDYVLPSEEEIVEDAGLYEVESSLCERVGHKVKFDTANKV